MVGGAGTPTTTGISFDGDRNSVSSTACTRTKYRPGGGAIVIRRVSPGTGIWASVWPGSMPPASTNPVGRSPPVQSHSNVTESAERAATRRPLGARTPEGCVTVMRRPATVAVAVRAGPTLGAAVSRSGDTSGPRPELRSHESHEAENVVLHGASIRFDDSGTASVAPFASAVHSDTGVVKTGVPAA